MRTLVVSDLHLGDRGQSDVLRRDGVAEALLAALADVERLVLLGDTIELRGGPTRSALAAARPFFERLGQRFAGREVILVPGNHDHALAADWHARRTRELSLEQRIAPEQASLLATELARALGGASLELAYPGLWLRPDVYAMHGHQLDVHFTVPTFERLAISLSSRVALDRSRRWNDPRTPEEYETLLAPLYAWIHAAAQSGRPGPIVGGSGTLRAWRLLGTGAPRSARSRVARSAYAVGVATLNRAGFGPLAREVSPTQLRIAGLRAMSEVVERLGIGAAHVLFGHTHRMGALSDDEPAQWRTPSGCSLHNPGSWVLTPSLIGARARASPYWPGAALLLEDAAPPRLLRLLSRELMPAPA